MTQPSTNPAAPTWTPTIPDDEDARVADLHALRPTDLKGREVFTRIAHVVSETLGIPNAGISVVDRDQEYYVASTLEPEGRGARLEAFCAHTILSDEPFVLEDATTDPVFRSHPKVQDGVRFYAGAPLIGPGGHRIGALCVRGSQPHTMSDDQRRLLQELANVASHALQTELDNVRLSERTEELQDALTNLQRLQGEIIEARKLESLGSMAAGVAHEINTPSQFIGDNLHFLADALAPILDVVSDIVAETDETTPAETAGLSQRLGDADAAFVVGEVPAALEQSIDGIGRISDIVRSLKDYAHPGGTEMAPSDLNRGIESTVVVCRSRWKDHADVDLELAPDLPAVHCRLSEINQVVMNLVVNAADAIAAAGNGTGRIKVSTERDGESVTVAVADNGNGIATEDQHRVYDPFFTTKEVGSGTGQGLSISRSVIEAHGGKLWFDTTPGTGTTFRFTLPIDGA